MANFEEALILLLLIASLSVVARWLPWPPLITYMLRGIGAALVPASRGSSSTRASSSFASCPRFSSPTAG
jgi:hypothetical protein